MRPRPTKDLPIALQPSRGQFPLFFWCPVLSGRVPRRVRAGPCRSAGLTSDRLSEHDTLTLVLELVVPTFPCSFGLRSETVATLEIQAIAAQTDRRTPFHKSSIPAVIARHRQPRPAQSLASGKAMRRRHFFQGITASAARPPAARAQQASLPVIGSLSIGSAEPWIP